MTITYHPNLSLAMLAGTSPEPTRRSAGTRRISADYTNSVRVLRAAVRANWQAGRGHMEDERADDTSLEVIDIVAGLDPAARRTLRLVAGQLRRACNGPQPRRRRANGNGSHVPFAR